MGFPRRFKQETWYTRLHTGEVELMPGSALESAFHTGLVDGRTPVRQLHAPVWTTLHEAAGLEDAPDDTVTSLVPMALEVADTDPTLGGQIRITEVDLDAKRVRPRRAPAIFAALAIAGIAIGFGTQPEEKTTLASATHAGVCRPGEEMPVELKKPGRYINDELKKRLHQLDFDHRWFGFGLPGHASHVQSASRAALEPPTTKKAPQRAMPILKGDPLDGRL